MAFVQGSKHDIFVTYARLDDTPFPGNDAGWVTTLVRNLEKMLSVSIGRTDAYSLWMDKSLLGNEPFTKTIQSNLRQSATLLAIVSPAYLKSEWCRQEQNAFLDELNRRSEDSLSVIVVEKLPIDMDELPLPFREFPHYRFWEMDQQDGHAEPLRVSNNELKNKQYYQGINALAANFLSILKRLAYSASPVSIESAPKPTRVSAQIDDIPEHVQEKLNKKLGESIYDVFMCHNSEDKEEVKRVGRMLMRQGHLPWLDDWDLRPGLPWQDALEHQITNIRSVAVFVGGSGFGPWQNMELSGFIREFVTRRCPVIPVLLANCDKSPQLPVLLSGLQYVDFRINPRLRWHSWFGALLVYPHRSIVDFEERPLNKGWS